jgi:hypothetical protein
MGKALWERVRRCRNELAMLSSCIRSKRGIHHERTQPRAPSTIDDCGRLCWTRCGSTGFTVFNTLWTSANAYSHELLACSEHEICAADALRHFRAAVRPLKYCQMPWYPHLATGDLVQVVELLQDWDVPQKPALLVIKLMLSQTARVAEIPATIEPGRSPVLTTELEISTGCICRPTGPGTEE